MLNALFQTLLSVPGVYMGRARAMQAGVGMGAGNRAGGQRV